jgi:hypothetical protein
MADVISFTAVNNVFIPDKDGRQAAVVINIRFKVPVFLFRDGLF